MKLFIRDHFLLILLQCIQLIMIATIYWLDGYHNVKLISYAIFLSFFFLICYLTYRYIRKRNYYKRLSNPMESLEASLEHTGSTATAVALDQLLRSQYRLYLEKLQEAEDRQDEHLMFMDRWVHQMKTPLSVIELMAQSLDEPESSSIREETERMRNGLNTVLYMARLRTIVEDFHIKPVVLSKLVHDVNHENKRFFIRNGVYPQLREDKVNLTVETDEKWLFFMVSQLVHNAVKYSAGKSNQIVIGLYEQSGEAVLEVKDDGIGIPEVDRKRVFNKFFTGENGRNFRESTGMGLYLVKEVTGKLDHRIELDSKVGEGTTIRIIFNKSQNLTSM
ncbi:sensor histidine kinase [Ornithinibacillus xuwenensis]|uniref:histidine kinase n=1 Tax=Ornithinibacillus xuwenensis TaxID=3144668 RepID=A0ABU9XI74_9BACI